MHTVHAHVRHPQGSSSAYAHGGLILWSAWKGIIDAFYVTVLLPNEREKKIITPPPTLHSLLNPCGLVAMSGGEFGSSYHRVIPFMEEKRSAFTHPPQWFSWFVPSWVFMQAFSRFSLPARHSGKFSKEPFSDMKPTGLCFFTSVHVLVCLFVYAGSCPLHCNASSNVIWQAEMPVYHQCVYVCVHTHQCSNEWTQFSVLFR